MSVRAIGHVEDSPEAVEEAVALLCRSVAIARWLWAQSG